MTTWNHYALCDPRDGAIRYIGRTTHQPKWRRYFHIWLARDTDDGSHKSNWIRQLLVLNLEPFLEDLGEGDENVEAEFIAYAKERGCNLTNGTEGGDGGPLTEGTKKKLSVIGSIARKKLMASEKGPEVRRKQSEGRKRYWQTSEGQAWLRVLKSRRKHTQDTAEYQAVAQLYGKVNRAEIVRRTGLTYKTIQRIEYWIRKDAENERG
jgi:hypothetical protein